MKKTITILLLFFSIASYGQQVMVRDVNPVDHEKINYPNLAGNTTSSQPHKGSITLKDGSKLSGKITFFKKKGEFTRVKVNTGEEKKEIEAALIASIALDPKIYERKYPNNFKNQEKNFQLGYIVLPNGTKINGKVAQVRDFSNYDFFINSILFLPDGSEVASTIRGGGLSEFGQQLNGKMNVWDGYADGYLIRMVDGVFRLSRNPYSKTKNEFFTALKNQTADDLSKEAAKGTLSESLNNGVSLNESIENASNAGSAVSEILGSVEVNKKEYLIFDTRTKSVTTVNKSNFFEFAQKLSSPCGLTITKDQVSWEKVDEFVSFLNASCK